MKFKIGLFCTVFMGVSASIMAVDHARYSGTAKAEVINALRAGQKVLATVATMADAKAVVSGLATQAPTQPAQGQPVAPATTTVAASVLSQIDPAVISLLSGYVYNVITAALEEGDLIMNIRNIFVVPGVKAGKKSIQTGQEASVSTPKRTYARQVTKSLIKETAHTTVGKLANLYLPGEELRIFRRIVKVVANTVVDGMIGFSVNYFKHSNLSNLKDISMAKPALIKGCQDGLKSLQESLIYETLGEILIRAIEGDDGVALLDALQLTGIADYFNQLAKQTEQNNQAASAAAAPSAPVAPEASVTVSPVAQVNSDNTPVVRSVPVTQAPVKSEPVKKHVSQKKTRKR